MPTELLIKKAESHYIVNPDLCKGKTINIFANENIIKELSEKTIQQAINTALTEGVVQINLNADAHEGYGCPIGSVVLTKNTVMLGPIGYDISCSVSYMQTDLSPDIFKEKTAKRELINKLCEYIPYGIGTIYAPKQIQIDKKTYYGILNKGASEKKLLYKLGINPNWTDKIERKSLPADANFLSDNTIRRGDGQIGSLGSGNHFLEAQRVKIIDKELAEKWGISEGVGFLTHCGSRGLGHQIATEYFKKLWDYFDKNNIHIYDRELVYAKIGTEIGESYIKSMGCAANFAIINHLVLNTSIKKAIKELYPNAKCEFIYLISHNIMLKEKINDEEYLVHRKGSIRALPPNHPELEDTKYYKTGHPVIIPGSSISGSSIMVGLETGEKNYYSLPHGAGRCMSRHEAKRRFTQKYVDSKMEDAGVLFNKRYYPIDEYTEAYKEYNQVINSIQEAGLAKMVTKMKPMFVIKGNEDGFRRKK